MRSPLSTAEMISALRLLSAVSEHGTDRETRANRASFAYSVICAWCGVVTVKIGPINAALEGCRFGHRRP